MICYAAKVTGVGFILTCHELPRARPNPYLSHGISPSMASEYDDLTY